VARPRFPSSHTLWLNFITLRLPSGLKIAAVRLARPFAAGPLPRRGVVALKRGVQLRAVVSLGQLHRVYKVDGCQWVRQLQCLMPDARRLPHTKVEPRA
jgi:hypothetical protein